MKKLLFIISVSLISISVFGQTASQLIPTQGNNPKPNSPPNFLYVNTADNRIWPVLADSLRFKPINIKWLNDSVVVIGDRRWVKLAGSYSNPTFINSLSASKISGLGTVAISNDYNDLINKPNLSSYYLASNPNGYISSFTEVDPVYNANIVNYRTKTQNDALYQPIGSYLTVESDPTVPAYSKSLTVFNVIKASTDPLYRPISYVPDTSVYRTTANSSTLAQEQAKFNAKQATLVSGTNIKTVGGTSLLGSGDIALPVYTAGLGISIVGNVVTNTSPYITPVISTPTIVLGTSYQAPSNKNVWVNASITHTIALTLVLSSGSSLVQLQTSPNNSTWTTVNSAGYSDAVAVAVALTKTVTNNVSGEVPPNYYYRLLATTSGAGSAAITNQQLKTY